MQHSRSIDEIVVRLPQEEILDLYPCLSDIEFDRHIVLQL